MGGTALSLLVAAVVCVSPVWGQGTPPATPPATTTATPPTTIQAPSGCDLEAHQLAVEANIEAMTADSQECNDLLFKLKQRQFGPPTEWETFNIMCKGPCLKYYFTALEVNAAGGCSCGEDDIDCYQLPVDFLCKLLQVCPDHKLYHRHTCRGCGWEALHEQEWHDDRDPDNCLAPATIARGGRAWATLIAATLVAALGVVAASAHWAL